ncbi:MAG: hypothetical protein GEU88_14730 [Solirubrobacterales bacterium]|nr:hypothetical protein [Solirubrobacterales bacterium]
MTIRRVVGVACALAALLVAPTTASVPDGKPRVKRLTLFTDRSETENGGVDLGPAGLSKGDVYVQANPVRNKDGKVVGTYDLSCTTIDEDNGAGQVRQLCDTATSLRRRGQIVTTGIVLAVPHPSATRFPGLLPVRRFTMPIVGGTGKFRGARGVLQRTFGDPRTTLRFRYRR